MNKLIKILIVVLLAVGLKAQETGGLIFQQLDEYLETELKKFPIPNLELLIVQDGLVVYTKSVGQGAGSETPYYIGSVSKSLTALGVLKLVENGALELDQRVADILPNVKFSSYREEITVRHLLNHTSGISKIDGFSKLPSLMELRSGPFDIKTHFKPGSRHEYSNLNYFLLGVLMEEVSGRTYDLFMQKEVFAPLDMKNTFAFPVEGEEENVINGYQYFLGYPVQSEQLNFSPTAVPAGFIRSSAMDMGRYMMMNLQEGMVDSQRILSAALLQTMHTPWNNGEYGYAMGWKQGFFNGKRLLQHLGSTATSYAGMFLLPEDETGLILLTNSNSLSFTEDLLTGVLHLVTGGEPEPVPEKEFYLRFGLGILLLFIIGQFIFKLIKYFREDKEVSRSKTAVSLAMNLGLLVAIILLFPIVAKIPFWRFLSIHPDIGWTILLSLVLSMLLSVIKLIRQ